MGALRQKRWRVKRQAGAPQEGPGGQQARGSPSSSPPAHSALLSDTSIDLSSRYDHRLAALLSTALFTSLFLQTKAGHRLHLMLSDVVSLALLFHATLSATYSFPPWHRACMNHQGALLDSFVPYK